jgi:hypothetical protein
MCLAPIYGQLQFFFQNLHGHLYGSP